MKAPARIERATEPDIPAWAALRARLWPESDAAAHAAELPALLASWPAQAAFLAHAGDGPLVGFAEASLRRDYVNGTSTSPVGFLGWFVDEGWRARGIGRALVDAVERWSRAQGCRELASDALLENTASHLAHAACGFAETERVVYFRKALD